MSEKEKQYLQDTSCASLHVILAHHFITLGIVDGSSPSAALRTPDFLSHGFSAAAM